MNIIKIENVRRIAGFSNTLEIKSEFKHNEKNSFIVILSENDINNDNCFIRLKGYNISALLIPNKFKFTFFETSLGKLIQPVLNKKYVISYY